ncbi:MAG TPA: metalloregulator ArsR/SmtB family transcription factor [Spirochaetota bacterium]|nr:metalloregulator ArsR/SmtB family transcription factor [Spirochaetota bacterium]
METVNIFKALSDESRLRILSLLRNNELSVNEIAAVLGMGQSRISRHLKILADAGLLAYRKEGLWVFYMMGNEGLWCDICGPVFDRLASGDAFKNDAMNLQNYLAERTERGREYFNSVAPEWKSIRSSMLGDFDLNSEICALMPESGIIADLGCGSGELAVRLLVKADRVIGVDRSPAMLAEARRLLEGKNGMIDLRLGELDHLPVRDGEADSVVISMVLHYLDEQQQAVDEASRILKPGGVLVLAELDSHNNEKMRSVYGHRRLGFSKETVSGWMKGAGLVLKCNKKFKAGEGLNTVIYMAVKVPLTPRPCE